MARILIPDLQPGATYAIQLRANDGEAVSQWSAITYINVDVGTVVPSTPTGLVWNVNDPDFFAVWNPVTTKTDGTPLQDLDYYEVTVSAASYSKTYKTTVPFFALPFAENKNAFGNVARPTVTISVKAVDRMGLKSAAASSTQTNPAPAPPTGFVANSYTGQVALSWNASTSEDVVAYKVYAGLTPTFTPSGATLVWAGSALQATYFSTDTTTDKYFKVNSVDVFGVESETSLTDGLSHKPLGIAGSVDSTPPADVTGLTVTQAANADTSGQFVDATVTWTGPTTASDSSLADIVIRYGYDGTTWNYITVPATQSSVKIPRVLAGGNLYVQAQAVDFTANRSAFVQPSTNYPLGIPKDTTGPSIPAAPTAAVGSQQIQVSHNLTKSGGGALEADVDYFEVFASTTSGFAIDRTAGTGNMLGTMKVNVVANQTFKLPAVATSGSGADSVSQKWYVRVVAVDKAGNKSSAASPETLATVDLILAAHIGKATITSAEIQEVNVGKLAAGVIDAVGDITARSRIIVGDATNNGDLRSYGYVAGSTGFKLDKTGLEINQGAISAAALKIQDSPNLMPLHYAGFEYSSGFYTSANAVYPTGGISAVIDTTKSKFENQSLRVSFTGSPVSQSVELAPDDLTTNVPVEPGDYIYSLWAINNGASAHTLWPYIHDEAGNSITVSGGNWLTTLPVGGGWVQRYGKFTVPSGVKKVRAGFYTLGQASADYNIDGVMIEKQTSATLIPSQWKPPGITKIDGGRIETNSILTEALTSNIIKSDYLDSEAVSTRHLESNLVVSKRLIATNPDLAISNHVDLGPEGLTFWQYQADGSFLDTISLPTDIEGTATFRGSVITEEISILNGATLRGSQNELARGAALVMAGNTTKPSAAPNYSFVYDNWDMNLFSKEKPFGLTKGHDGKFYTYVQERDLGFSADTIVAFDTSTSSGNWTWAKNDGYFPEGGIVYSATTSRYYMLTRKNTDSSWHLEIWGTDKLLKSRQTWRDAFSVSSYSNFRLGMDHVNDRLLILGSDRVNPETDLWSYTYTSSFVSLASETISNGNFGFYLNVAYIGHIPQTDMGQYRMVWRGETGDWKVRSTAFTTNYTTNYGWPAASAAATGGAWYDGTNFYEVTWDGIIYKYEGDSAWYDSSVDTGLRFVANTYRDENPLYAEGSAAAHEAANGGATGVHKQGVGGCGGIHETDLGTKTSFTMKKRAKLKITGNSLPNYNLANDPLYPNGLGADDPNGYGFWLGKPAVTGGTTVTDADMKLVSRPGAGVLSVTVTGTNFSFIGGTTASGLVNKFPVAPPASIKSGALDAGGAPLLELRADGYAKLNQLIVDSSTDATRNANNEPALRVGSITGAHLRIDGDEIVKMNSNTADDQGLLTLNQSLRDANDVSIAGGVRISRGGIIRAWNMGVDTKSTNANSEIFIPHGLGETPTAAVVTPQNSNIHASITGIGPVNITCVLRQISNGALDPQGSSRLVYWQAAVVA